jgi:glycerol-3-phosphate dehydrogenase
MKPLSFTQRATALQGMAAHGVDILIIGGGVTGAGTALDAAARGYRVGLVEKADFASGTTSKSTKLVHGGIRYLPQFDFALVREALIERGLLVQNAPFLVRPLGFVLPIYAENRRPLGTPIVPPFGFGMGYLLQAGLLMYDLLSGRLGVGRHRRLGKKRAARLIPCLRTTGLIDAFMYYDGQTDDTRLTSTLIRTAAQHGAQVANYAEVTGFTQEAGRIVAAQVRDHLSGASLTIRASTVINAGGVFAGRIEALAGSDSQVQIAPAKGVHLTIARETLKLGRHAVVLPETEDGRLLFLVPWGPRITIGTTDTPGGDVDRPVADAADVDYLLRHVNRYMDCHLTRADIISTWAGYRPLVSARKGDPASSKLSRTHVVLDSPGGMITIVGGKLTTYRRMAQDVLDHSSRQRGDRRIHPTMHLPLEGTRGWQEAAAAVAAAAPRYGLRADTVQRLGLYGATAQTILDLLAEDASLAARLAPDLPYIMAEVVYACRYEMAMHLDDILARRLHLNFEDWSRGAAAAPAVAARMARELHWDDQETARQVAVYQAGIESLPDAATAKVTRA